MDEVSLLLTALIHRNLNGLRVIGQGKSVSKAEIEAGSTVEGLLTARAIHAHAHRLDIELPIMEQNYQACYQSKNPHDAVMDLENRPQRSE